MAFPEREWPETFVTALSATSASAWGLRKSVAFFTAPPLSRITRIRRFYDGCDEGMAVVREDTSKDFLLGLVVPPNGSCPPSRGHGIVFRPCCLLVRRGYGSSKASTRNSQTPERTHSTTYIYWVFQRRLATHITEQSVEGKNLFETNV